MGSGKDESAAYLTKYWGARRWPRSDLMKQLSHAAVGNGDLEESLQAIFPESEERALARREILEYVASYDAEQGKARALYQDIIEICLGYDPLCFDIELAERINSTDKNAFHVIEGIRSLAGFEFFVAQGYKSLRIEAPLVVREQRMKARDGFLPAKETYQHPSEIELDNVVHDFTIDNSGDDPKLMYPELDQIVKAL
jgi:hypothetical protein